MDTNNDRLYLPAQVRAVGDTERIATLAQLLRTNRVLDTSILDQHPPFFWRALISNTRVDAYFTHMRLSSLRNYAADAAAGVSFLPGHDHKHLPVGGSLTGELSEEAGQASVRADFYTLSGLQIGNFSTDGLIVGIKGGLTRDVSIGMYGGEYICDICEQNYLRGRCPHLAGFTYEEEKDGVIRQILCTVGIEDARLAEVSGVYDGATPGAMIEKVYELARAGALSTDDVRHAESVYRLDREVAQRMLALPALQKKSAGVDTKGHMPGRERLMDLAPEGVTKLRNVLDKHKVGEGRGLVEAIDLLDTEMERLRAVDVRVKELEPRAADGDAYRNDLVSEALAEGVRAYGDKFAKDTYEATLRSAPLAVIKQMKADWAAVGNSRFAPGRQTTDGDESAQAAPSGHPNGKQVEIRAPAGQYK